MVSLLGPPLEMAQERQAVWRYDNLAAIFRDERISGQ